MLIKQSNSILDMFSTIHQLYKNVEIDGVGTLGIEVVGHAVMIINYPTTKSLFYQSDCAGGVVVQTYEHQGPLETMVCRTNFKLNDCPSIEDHMISTFIN